jgi:hypothetical protein
MSMPGFAAETSLYKTRGHYRAMASTPPALVGRRGVLPQREKQEPGCTLYGSGRDAYVCCTVSFSSSNTVETCCYQDGSCVSTVQVKGGPSLPF